ncbi:unnamed protein product [Rotaria magnacalcarata]
MSTSDTPAQHQPKTSYDSDDSSSSRSVFNRSDFQTIAPQAINTQFNSIFSEGISSVVKAINYEQMRKSNSQIPFLEDKINDQNKTLNNQQSEISNLHKTLGDLYDQMHHLKSVVNSAPHSPVVRPRPNSAIYDLNQYDSHKKIYFYKSTSPTCIRRRHETTSPQIAQATSLYHDNMLPDDNQTRILQEALHKLNAAFERRDAQIDDLKKEINELRQFQSNTGNTTRISATLLMRTLISSPKNLHASALVPIVVTDRSRPAILPTNKFTSTSAMPFTMSLAKILPNFSGKECEMPTKFITEFEILASGLVGNSDEYLLRAVQQSLSETALTWYIQTQLEQPVNKKIESLRGRLRSLWKNDNEPTADYFERLKALMSEIEPQTSTDYIKRKFLQKLRKDIRDKMSLGLTSSLSDLVQKAIEIESSIIQQKIDDKLRDVHKDNNINKQTSATVNNLYNDTQFNPSATTTATHHKNTSHNNSNNNFNYDNTQNHHADNKYSRTFLNSTTLPSRSSQIQNKIQTHEQNSNRNTKVRFRNNSRWCSFCSSTSHNWIHCYYNPDGPNYDPTRNRYLQQQQYNQQPNSLSHNSQQQNFDPQHQYLSSNQHELTHQQQQQQQYYSPYSSSQRSSMQKNI